MKYIWLGMMVAGCLFGQQSPAARPRPKSVAPQTYTAAQVKSGEGKFTGQCGFCHGRDAAGGEGGPDLTRSEVVAADNRGDKIGEVMRAGRADKGMPSFKLSDADTLAIAGFIHSQKTKFDALGGGRQQVAPEDLAGGNVQVGERYFAANCARCHAATGDLKGVATRFQGLALMQRLLYPTNGRPAPARPKVTVTTAAGRVITGTLAAEDEFTVAVQEGAGERQTFDKTAVKFTIDDPMAAHFDQLAKYTDTDMHNVYAFLSTLK
jgi:cytochrome c oxidase cbb3-type subunit 3